MSAQHRVALFKVSHGGPGTIYGDGAFALSEGYHRGVGCVRVTEWVEVAFPPLRQLDLLRAQEYLSELKLNIESMTARRDECAARVALIEEEAARA